VTRVLHVVRDWVQPSEGFVADVVGRSSSPAVAYGRRGTGAVPDVPAHGLGRLASRGDKQLRLGIAAVAARHRSQVLHAHFGYWAEHVEAVARRRGRPWSVALHGYDLLVDGCPAALHADAVVVPSSYLADAAVTAGVRADRLHVIPSGLDLSRYPFRARTAPSSPPVVTFAGRYVEKKGVLDVARALAGVPGIRRRFVGYGPLEGDLRALLVELGADADLVDGAAPGAVRQALQETDLLVTGSKLAADGDAESLGLVNLEALACGIPVVTTRSGGIPFAVGDHAVLVPEGDVDALRQGVVDLLADPASWEAVGRAGRRHVEEHFDLDGCVASLEALWDGLAS
jgi:colanic acid/amylovoran biosynthesis glycosyltransferase